MCGTVREASQGKYPSADLNVILQNNKYSEKYKGCGTRITEKWYGTTIKLSVINSGLPGGFQAAELEVVIT